MPGYPILLLGVGHLLQLEVLSNAISLPWSTSGAMIAYPVMNSLSTASSLDEDEDDGSNNGDKVEWQVHEVPDDRFDRELIKGALEGFAEL